MSGGILTKKKNIVLDGDNNKRLNSIKRERESEKKKVKLEKKKLWLFFDAI